MSQIAIIIVNYRAAALTINCLASLASDGYSSRCAHVYLVDNASVDGSVDVLRAAVAARGWTSWITLIESPRNGGFAAGNNLALHAALADPVPPDYLLLLNPDTLVYPITIEALVCFLNHHPRAAIAGSRLFDSAGVVQCAAHNFPSPLGELEAAMQCGPVSRMLRRWAVSAAVSDEAHSCDWVSGAAFMIRADVVRQVGLLDESFFLYFEEVDWCRRAKEAGWEVWHIPASHVAHLEGGSTGVSQKLPAGRHFRASRRRYFRKHHGVLGLCGAEACRAVGRAGSVLLAPARAILSRRPDQFDAPASAPLPQTPSLDPHRA